MSLPCITEVVSYKWLSNVDKKQMEKEAHEKSQQAIINKLNQ